METLEVVASFDWLENEETIGYLSYDQLGGKDVFTFEYTKEWIKKHSDIILGGDLQPFTGKQHTQPDGEIFGCFADCLPDFWGRTLIELKERQTNSTKGRLTYNLSDWVCLKGVEDSLRIGGFRFKDIDTGLYLNVSADFQVPPILSLEMLFEAAKKVEESEFKSEEPDNRWLERLLKPGTSVGGARPKACISDENSLYIAKFPSTTDRWNDCKWEYFANKMAEQCGIHIATTKLISLSSGHDVFLSKRFDRTPDGKRIHMASALNLLGLTQEDTHKKYYAYPEIADFIVSNGTEVEKTLQELYRRIAYTICIGNTDDHLKNHSFLLTKKGWELSPVYDINPSVGHTHSLLIDGVSNESSLDNLFKAHKLYKIDEETAYDIIKNVTLNMKHWKDTARDCGISEKEKAYDDFSQRFTEGMSWSN